MNTSSAITLRMILTAGPNGSQGAAVSADYSAALGVLSVVAFASTPDGPLPLDLNANYDTGSRIESLDSGSILPRFRTDGRQSHQLRTITFQKDRHDAADRRLRRA